MPPPGRISSRVRFEQKGEEMNRAGKIVLVVAAALAIVLVFLVPAVAESNKPNNNGGGDKVTLCHAAGLDGTTKYVTLTLSENAVYKEQGGHFYENGTPRAGHEDDYLGPCITDGPTDPTTGPTEPVTTTETDNKVVYPDCTHLGRALVFERTRTVTDGVAGEWSEFVLVRVLEDQPNPNFPACEPDEPSSPPKTPVDKPETPEVDSPTEGENDRGVTGPPANSQPAEVPTAVAAGM
jgi:hypothetical protein